jgi:hypothetical protein
VEVSVNCTWFCFAVDNDDLFTLKIDHNRFSGGFKEEILVTCLELLISVMIAG